jgi:hypothetical protein
VPSACKVAALLNLEPLCSCPALSLPIFASYPPHLTIARHVDEFGIIIDRFRKVLISPIMQRSAALRPVASAEIRRLGVASIQIVLRISLAYLGDERQS